MIFTPSCSNTSPAPLLLEIERLPCLATGTLVVVVTIDFDSGTILAVPDLISRGFVYVRESEQLMEDARKAVADALDKCLRGKHTDWNKIKLVIRDAMNDYIWKKTKRRPMVIPIIMDVDV